MPLAVGTPSRTMPCTMRRGFWIVILFLLLPIFFLWRQIQIYISGVRFDSVLNREIEFSSSSTSTLPSPSQFCRQLQTRNKNDDRQGNTNDPTAAVASWWWAENLDKILEASLFPTAIRETDAEYEYQYNQSSTTNKAFYQDLLVKAGTAFQLEQSLLTHPSIEDIERIYGILERRWLWFSSRHKKDNKNDDSQTLQPPHPLKILVMGGSATVGADCEQPVTVARRRKNKSGNPTALLDNNNDNDSNHSDWEDYIHVIERLDCNWSIRLESFMNLMLGYDAIRVINIAQGGTNSKEGSLLVKYQLSFPDDWNEVKRMADGDNSDSAATEIITGPPDIIIHAYGTNDANGGSNKNEAERIKNTHQSVTTRLNGFVEAVKKSFGGECQQHVPILFFLDDYNGGFFQGSILGDRTYRMVLRELSDWYSLMAVSSAKVIENLVYPDVFGEQNISFAPKQWDYKTRRGNPHFPYTAHIVVVWSWAYSALASAVKYCNTVELQEHENQHQQNSVSNDNPKDKRQQRIQVPVLDYSLEMHNVSDALKQQKTLQEKSCRQDSSNNINQSKICAMAWIANMNPLSTVGSLRRAVNPFIGYNDGWKTEYDMSTGRARKPGFIAKKKGAVLQFNLFDLSIPLNMLTIQYLRSYGETWEGSQVLITVRRKKNLPDWTETTTTHLSGIHDEKTSITYDAEIHFPHEIEMGSDVQVEIQLTGGTTFKIIGMMLCSR